MEWHLLVYWCIIARSEIEYIIFICHSCAIELKDTYHYKQDSYMRVVRVYFGFATISTSLRLADCTEQSTLRNGQKLPANSPMPTELKLTAMPQSRRNSLLANNILNMTWTPRNRVHWAWERAQLFLLTESVYSMRCNTCRSKLHLRWPEFEHDLILCYFVFFFFSCLCST